MTIDGLFPSRSNILLVNLNILTYGSVYQGGYVYSIDDSTVNTGSIAGKVVSTSDQAPPFPNGIFWSSNGDSSTSGSRDSIPGIADTSTTGSSVPTYASAEASFNSTYLNSGTNPFPLANCLAGGYWSSTEFFNNPTIFAWVCQFQSGGNSSAGTQAKFVVAGVRCSRALTTS